MQPEPQEEIRRMVRIGTRMVQADGSALGICLITEISAVGARLKLETSDALPEQFTLLLSHNGQLRRHCAVEWQSENDVGVRFIANSAIK